MTKRREPIVVECETDSSAKPTQTTQTEVTYSVEFRRSARDMKLVSLSRWSNSDPRFSRWPYSADPLEDVYCCTVRLTVHRWTDEDGEHTESYLERLEQCLAYDELKPPRDVKRAVDAQAAAWVKAHAPGRTPVIEWCPDNQMDQSLLSKFGVANA